MDHCKLHACEDCNHYAQDYNHPYGGKIKVLRSLGLGLVLACLGIYSSTEAQSTKNVMVTWSRITPVSRMVMAPIVQIISEDPSAAVVNITVENIRSRWYIVSISPVGTKIGQSTNSLPKSFVLAPFKSYMLGDLTFGPRESLALLADGTANNPQILFFIAADFVTRTALGESFSDIIDPTNAANACFGVGMNWSQIGLCRTLVGIGQDINEIRRGSIIARSRAIGKLLVDITALADSEELRIAFHAAFGRELPAGLGWLANIYQVLELTLGTLLAPESDGLIFQASATSATRPNQSPIIQKIEAQPSIVRPGGTSTISVSASDPEGDPLTYSWSVTNGTLSSVTGPEAKIWTAPNKIGIYEVRVSVTDNQPGRKPVSTSVRIQVANPLNRIPVANAGLDQIVRVGSTVQLDGRSSSDPDGDVLKYSWKFIKRPSGSRAQLSKPNIANPTFKADKEGEYLLELKVDDGRGGTATDQVKITARTDITPPALITDFQASDNENRRSTLTWTNPPDNDLAEVLVRRKTDGYPANHTDGTLVYQNTSPSRGAPVSYVDTGLTNGTTYYYAVFSRDQAGNWNDQVIPGKNADTGRLQGSVVLTHPWPMFQHDAQHTGRSPFTGPETPVLKWSFSTRASPYIPSVVIGIDGVIYLTLGPSESKLYALNPDGSLRWTFFDAEQILSPVIGSAIGSDGTIYVVYQGIFEPLGPGVPGRLYAVNPDGSLKWVFYPNKQLSSSPTIGSDGTIYVSGGGAWSGALFAINPDGTLKWMIDSGPLAAPGGTSSPAIGSDGTIYVGSSYGVYYPYLYAINPNGSTKWTFLTGSHVTASPTIAADGTIYVGSHDGKLYAVSPDGSLRWSFDTGAPIESSAAIGHDGTIYVTSRNNNLYAINPDGTLNWTLSTGLTIEWQSPVVDANGTIYYTGSGHLYALNPDGSLKWSFAPMEGYRVSSPAIGADGTVYYITGRDGDSTLYAIGVNSSNVAASITPSETLKIRIQNIPNPARGTKMKFAVEGYGIKDIQLQIFDLAGRSIFNTDWIKNNAFEWNLLNNRGQPVANGVYLYVVCVRGYDGREYVSEVHKLVILR